MSDASMSISLEELDAYLVEYKRSNENSNFYVVAATINGYHHFGIGK